MDRWIFMSDVCKHCTNAGCLDACPTGALIRTEFQTVLLQPDVCNGCGYCIPACPFGVVDRDHIDGRAGKCTLCYDRLEDGLEPACAKACPTDSIQFGPYEELVAHAERRVAELHRARRGGRVPLRRRRRARARPRRRPRRVLPADRAARALRAAGRGRVAGPGERRAPRRPRRLAPGCSRRRAPRWRSPPRGGTGERRRRNPLGLPVEPPAPEPDEEPPRPARPPRGMGADHDTARATSRRRWARGASRRRGGRRRAEHVALARPSWGDAGWSYLYGRGHAVRRRRARPGGDRGGQPARCASGSDAG